MGGLSVQLQFCTLTPNRECTLEVNNMGENSLELSAETFLTSRN